MLFVSHFHGEYGLSLWTDDLAHNVRCAFGGEFLSGLAFNANRNALIATGFSSTNTYTISRDLVGHVLPWKGHHGLHGICTYNDWLLVTDTAVDRLQVISLDKGCVEAQWAFGREHKDLHHLNSVCFGEDGPPVLYATAFTLKRKREGDEEGSWKQYTKTGVVIDLSNWWTSNGIPEVVDSGFSHPHTVRVYGESLWLCESASGTLWWGSQPFWRHHGYLRGLAFTPSSVFCATSMRSEFKGFGYEDVSRLFRLNMKGEVENEVALPKELGEVFAIVHLSDEWYQGWQ